MTRLRPVFGSWPSPRGWSHGWRPTEWPRIEAAATVIAEALAAGRAIHAFGSGHSHMLAEEMFYRAGGLVRVRPILFEGLMLHASAPLSTALERLPGLAAALLDDHPMARRRRAASSPPTPAATPWPWTLRVWPRAAGVHTIALTSLGHATSSEARDQGAPRLHEVAELVIDNGGVVGDAAVDIAGLPGRVAPTSTVVGAAIIEALVAEVVERLVARGIVPEVYASSNVAGGDAVNRRFTACRGRAMTGSTTAAALSVRRPGRDRGLLRRPVDPRAAPRADRIHGQRGMNTFVYGPKDDPLVRRDWRSAYDGDALRARRARGPVSGAVAWS